MFCANCDTSLEGLSDDASCPSCGSCSRTAKTTALLTAGVVAMAGRVGLKVVRGDSRPWTDRWLKILRSLESLREAYALDASAVGIEGVSDRADNFFVHCFHLKDWLVNTGTASVADVQAHIDSTPLRWCDAMCNSDKHHTRTRGVTARIRETSISPEDGRATVTIEVDWAGPTAKLIDALDLAEQCVDAWRQFFAQQGIAEP